MSLLLKALKQIPAADVGPSGSLDSPQAASAEKTVTGFGARFEPSGGNTAAVQDAASASAAIPIPEETESPLDLGPPWSVEMLEPSIEEYQAFTSLPEPEAIEASPVFEVRSSGSMEGPSQQSQPSEPELPLPSVDRLELLKKMLLDLEAAPVKESTEHCEQPTVPTAIADIEPQIALEYRELADHLLARFPATKRVSLLLLDAGRVPGDSGWLIPFAAALEASAAKRSEGRMPTQQAFKILIVDLANQQGGLARQLGLQSSGGLTKLLAGNVTCEDAILSTGQHHVDLLPYGEGILTKEIAAHLPSLWARLQERYPIILIAGGAWSQDGHGSNASAFLPVANAVALCVELGATPQTTAVAARQAIAAAGANLVGCIVRGESAVLN